MFSDAECPVLDAVRAAFDALQGDARVALGLSGGLDSSVLADAAVRVGGAARLVVLHIHHGLSPRADAWRAHCAAFARARGLVFDAACVAVPCTDGTSLEEAARNARYTALDTLCATHGATALWLAQHADDQAETVLLQLLRGAGLPGLAAMGDAPASVSGNATLRMRPLLRLPRTLLESYAAVRGLNWIDDESNADIRFARNALRHQVLPALAGRFPGYRAAFARSAAHAASAQRLLDELARVDLRDIGCGAAAPDRLQHRGLLALDDDRAANLLRYWMRSLGLRAASSARLADMLRQLRCVDAGHAMRIVHAGRTLRCYRNTVYWENRGGVQVDEAAGSAGGARVTLVWRGDLVWRLPDWRGTFVFTPSSQASGPTVPQAVLEAAPLVACVRSGGERMRCEPGRPGRSLKSLFQRRGIPAWRRDLPLLYAGGRLLFVPELGVNLDALPAASSGSAPRIAIEWRPDLLLA